MENDYTYGYIHETPPQGAIYFGSADVEGVEVLEPSRDWTRHLPTYESQIINKVFDSRNCTNFALLNVAETFVKCAYGLEKNWSDRFPAYTSGNSKLGNTFSKTSQAWETHGVVEEEIWPTTGVKSWDEYMTVPPLNVLQRGKMSLTEYDFYSEYVPLAPDVMYEALGHCPLRVAVHAWEKPKNGIYEKTNKEGNHAVTLFKGEYGKNWYIYDHYDQNGNAIKKLSWDFRFWAAQIHYVTIKNMSKFVIAKQEDGKGYAILGEANQEEEFKNVCEFLGIPLPLKDGKIDWENVKHEVMYHKV